MKRLSGSAYLKASAAPLALLIAGQAFAQTAPAETPIPAASTAQRAEPDAGIVDPDAQAGEDIIVSAPPAAARGARMRRSRSPR